MRSLIAFLFLLPIGLFSQHLSSERIIPLRGYSVQEMGYPLQATGAGEEQFAFLQYWPRDTYHGADNYYVQCLTPEGYELVWDAPVTDAGYEPMRVSGLYTSADGLWVTGKQYLAKDKMVHTVGRFFDFQGKPASREPVALSCHDRKAEKNLSETLVFSPERKTLLWMGTDGRRHFLSAWGPNGRQRWAKELALPFSEDNYAPTQVVVDEEGNPTFLMQYTKAAYSLKDTLHPPLLLHYRAGEQAFISDTLHIDSAFVTESALVQAKNGEVVVVAVLGTGDETGIANGALSRGQARPWEMLLCQRFGVGDSLALLAQSRSDFPEAWRERYAAAGSNFSVPKILSDGTTFTWVWEEAYVQKERAYYYDLGVMAFDIRSSELRWAHTVEKRQRTQGSGAYLSYVSGLANGKLQLVYLTELGAPGKIFCTSFDLRNGRRSEQEIVSNENSQYLFLPADSRMTGKDNMVLIGIGHPDQNDFKLMTIRF